MPSLPPKKKILSILAKDSLKIEIELSLSMLFHMNTIVFLKYLVRGCSWKYRRFSISLKTLIPRSHAAKYRYRKGMGVVRTRETGMSQTQEIKTFYSKNECNGVNFGVVTKFKFRYSIAKFPLVWLNQLTGLHPPLWIYQKLNI